MADSAPLKTYRGNCHCTAFVYEFQAPEIDSAWECNCSICRKKGYLLIPVGVDKFTVVKGDEEKLTSYTFGEGKYVHKFCGECGTGVLCRSKTSMAINAHSIQNLDTWDLKTKSIDGASQGPKYEPPKHKGELPTGQIEGGRGKTYTGACHCGKLTVATNAAPLDETYDMSVVICNCSVCERSGAVWIYPTIDNTVLAGNESDVGARAFNGALGGILQKTFCRTCGVFMTNRNLVLSGEPLQTRPEGRNGAVERFETHPVNVRVLDDESIDIGKLKITRSYGRDWPPLYINP